MTEPLEEPDTYVSLDRAAELCARSPDTLRALAVRGRLRTVKIGRKHLTTRRWLHEYLMQASGRDQGRCLSLPESYVAPE